MNPVVEVLEPQGPDVPSTLTQSVGSPVADSSSPVGPTTAALDALYSEPLTGRAASSLARPVTSAISIGAVSAPITGVDATVLTALRPTGVTLAGTAHVSMNWVLPSLL